MSSLQLLDTSNNWLSGSMPPIININTSSLQHLDVSTNNMSGHLPLDMFYNLPQLEVLYLYENMFSGRIPPSLFQCKQLVYLVLEENNFQGSIPEEIGNLTRLQVLYLGHNNFNGKIPGRVGELKSLEYLHIPECHLTGPIPLVITNLTLLKTIIFSSNNLSEYGSGGHISGKGDVYSYGILLMETITSKKPTDEMFSGDMSLKQLVGDSLLNGSVTEIVDSDLLHQNDLHFAAKKQCAASILSLAINCTTNLPVERINMEEVGSRLEKIKSALLASIERRSRYLPRVGVNQVHALKVLVE
ncbi:hypothetical protein HS088_TW21G01343 [Tripterygium wilfordii]|uniref:Uncharacterized protein n=1 Tax=Tripterygium wilfordii TaxID=458696 RepID=A0A7J7C4Y3_TRIWF|nr:hypothetical protein HS088_TW21G01343 [Tripterygium wilfordii]